MEKENDMDPQVNNLLRRKEKILKELEKIRSLEKQFPEGELMCAKNGKHYKWYVKDRERRVYLPRSEKERAEALALKKYYIFRKQELENRLSACCSYIKKEQAAGGKSEQLLSHPGYGCLLEKYFVPLNKELRQWQEEDYERCRNHEESLVIRGTQGKWLRSKSEAMIDMLLYKNQIPFRYEEKLVLGGVTVVPDFVIRHPRNGKFFYWEHFGMMDEEEYRNHACHKIRHYCENGIIPSVSLIMTFETKQFPLSPEKVEWILQGYFDV